MVLTKGIIVLDAASDHADTLRRENHPCPVYAIMHQKYTNNRGPVVLVAVIAPDDNTVMSKVDLNQNNQNLIEFNHQQYTTSRRVGHGPPSQMEVMARLARGKTFGSAMVAFWRNVFMI